MPDLGTILDGIVDRIASTRRPGGEGPEGFTRGYLAFVLASSFAHLGKPARAKALAEEAHRLLATADDPVHHWLIRAFDVRIENALARRPRTAALPPALM